MKPCKKFYLCVLGHLVREGIVVKVSDDLYCGGMQFKNFVLIEKNITIQTYKVLF